MRRLGSRPGPVGWDFCRWQGVADGGESGIMTIVHSGAVSSAALAGQPARPVVRQLRRDGLQVCIEWAPAQGSAPTGTIIAVSPEGVVEAGAVVTLTVAAPPGD
jgi:hypothetical protein